MTRNPSSKAVLHRRFWEQKSNRGTLTIVQKELAEELGIHYVKMSRIMAEMVDEGRIKPFKRRNHQIATYQINDPADFPSRDVKKPRA